MFSPEQNYFFLFAMRCTNRSSSRKKTEINKEINYGGPGSMPRINFDDICPRPQQNSAPSETKLHPRNKGMRPHQKPNSTRDEGMQPHQKPNSTRNKGMRPHQKPNSTRDKGMRPHQKPNSTRNKGMQPHQKPNSTRNKGMWPHQKPNSTRDEGMQPHQKPNSTRNKDMRPHWKPNSTRDKGIATIKQQREEAHQKRLQEEENYRLACLHVCVLKKKGNGHGELNTVFI